MRAFVVQHDHVTDPGEVGARLDERGYDLTTVTVVPESRHSAPDVTFDFPDADEWDLIVSLGAPWSLYDDVSVGSWIGGELSMLHHLGTPVLGVCFGAQALTCALGGSVKAARRPEIGWTEIETDVPELVPPGPWFQWHFDRCFLAPGTVELARNSVCPQAFRAGRSLGVQFHPEISYDVLRGWLDHGGAEQCARHGLDAGELLSQTREMEQQGRERARRLVDGFLDRVAGAPPSLP